MDGQIVLSSPCKEEGALLKYLLSVDGVILQRKSASAAHAEDLPDVRAVNKSYSPRMT